MVLAAETIEREVFPGLKLNGIIDVSFQGFIRVVDTLGCAYVNVDHRYYNENVGSTETDYTSINLQPGYQKLCYENALDYVRYRHTDSDFVRVARQQDFLRDLREQISPDKRARPDRHGRQSGRARDQSRPSSSSASELIELAKLIGFSQAKPLRQVKFQSANVDFKGPSGGSYVTTTPALAQATLDGIPARPRNAQRCRASTAAPRAPRATAITTPAAVRALAAHDSACTRPPLQAEREA